MAKSKETIYSNKTNVDEIICDNEVLLPDRVATIGNISVTTGLQNHSNGHCADVAFKPTFLNKTMDIAKECIENVTSINRTIRGSITLCYYFSLEKLSKFTLGFKMSGITGMIPERVRDCIDSDEAYKIANSTARKAYAQCVESGDNGSKGSDSLVPIVAGAVVGVVAVGCAGAVWRQRVNKRNAAANAATRDDIPYSSLHAPYEGYQIGSRNLQTEGQLSQAR
jgi:hypothetical protein